MIAWILLAHLLLAQVEADSSGRLVNTQHGLSIAPVSGWVAQTDPADEALVFRLVPEEEKPGSMLSLRVQETQAPNLKTVWTNLRYSAIVELGGKIISDTSYKVGNASGRMLIYKGLAPSTGRERMFLRVHLLQRPYLYTFHAVSEPSSFAALRPKLEASIRSLRWQNASAPQE
jgi:hypothetical protein